MMGASMRSTRINFFSEPPSAPTRPVISRGVALTEEQVEFRRTVIGGSDAAAVLGISPWKSQLELWLEKTGRSDDSISDSTALRLGSFAEPFIAAEVMRGAVTVHFSEEPGALEKRVMSRIADGKQPLAPGLDMVRHPEHECMGANTDRGLMAIDHSITRPWGIVELKTAGSRSFFLGWRDGVPLHYQIQCQHYMAVTGALFAVVACLDLAHQTVHAYFLPRDNAFIDGKLIPACLDFWSMVESGTIPQVDDSSSCARALATLYPEPDPAKAAEFGDHDTAIVSQYEDAKRQLAKFKKRETGLKNLILEALEDASVATMTDGRTLKRQKSGRGYTLKIKENQK